MTFQTLVRAALATGIAGELAYEGPLRATPFTLRSADATNNVVSRAFTVVPGEQNVARAGGTGDFAGLLANPKVYAHYGTAANGTLAATMTLPNETIGELVDMGQMFANLANVATIGDKVMYDTTTGALSAMAKNVAATGAIADTTLTVSAITAGNLGVGSLVTGANVLPGTIITALGTGTGGVGTYTVSPTQTAATAAISAASVPTTGNAFVPNAEVDRFNVTVPGLAVVRLTN